MLIEDGGTYLFLFNHQACISPVGRSVVVGVGVVRLEWLMLLARVYVLSPACGCAPLPLFVGNP
ncbi:hypothetical protein BDV32DRAFT_130247 [Aspergillus pseudonomiae]|nr:hypothetical protein BDV32DRAFT_130247 [Aspergillus pseudonomiae]